MERNETNLESTVVDYKPNKLMEFVSITKKAAYITLAAVVLNLSGCVTGIVEKPNLSRLNYDRNGVLRYNGKKAEVRYVLNPLVDALPDSLPEFLFNLGMGGLGYGLRTGSGDSGGEEEAPAEEPAAAPSGGTKPAPTSKPKPAPEPDPGGFEEED